MDSPTTPSMATTITSSPQLNHFQMNSQQRQGILLPTHTQQKLFNIHSFPTRPPLQQRTHSSRRIRFAPLPDPRRSVLITDDGNELPLPQAGSATQFPAPPTPSPAIESRHDYFSPPDSASLISISTDSKRNSLLEPSSSSSGSSASGTTTPVSITTTTPSEYDTNSSVPPSPITCPPSPLAAITTKLSGVSNQKGGPLSFLRSLKRNSGSSSSSSNTLTPTPSIDRTHTPTATSFSRRNFSAEEILTFGTINLFRATSSRETSDNEGASSSGWSLARWSSAGSHHSHNHKEPNWGSPLARVSSTQSTQSYQSKSKNSVLSSKSFRPSSSTGLRPSRKGTRMLNGRVYGVKRPNANANPFANARDEEPEFVEWGYGGMGSVKGATSAGAHGRWGRLQGQSTTSTKDDVPVGEEEDDGSGMMWVKKRREQRERERKEKEEQEKIAEEKEEKGDVDMEDHEEERKVERSEKREELSRPGTAGSAKTVSAASSHTATPCASSASTVLAVAPTSPSASIASPTASLADEEHVTRAVNVPAPHHYVHRPHSRSGSKDVMMMMNVVPAPVKAKEIQTPTESRSNSESESESDAEHEEESEESEEEEDEEQERRRRTAVGAGVEKISRHH